MVARAALLLACVAAIVAAPERPAAQGDALFEFHSNPWLNLHHILWAHGERAAPPAAVLFYTAGELTVRELKKSGVAYGHYAEGGLYDRLCGSGCGDKLAAHWGPFLDDRRTRAEAFTALVASFK